MQSGAAGINGQEEEDSAGGQEDHAGQEDAGELLFIINLTLHHNLTTSSGNSNHAKLHIKVSHGINHSPATHRGRSLPMGWTY